MEAETRFELVNIGFANRSLRPLGHSAILRCYIHNYCEHVGLLAAVAGSVNSAILQEMLLVAEDLSNPLTDSLQRKVNFLVRNAQWRHKDESIEDGSGQ